MSILEKCEKIGLELKKCEQGAKIIGLYQKLIEYDKETMYIYFQLLNQYYVNIHFFAPSQAVDILVDNTDNQYEFMRENIQKLLSIPELHQFAEANLPFAKLVEKLSVMSFNNTVKYSPPTQIIITPETVRLMNSLTVECQRIDLIKNLITAFTTNSEFQKAIPAYDNAIKDHQPFAPYSKQNRKMLMELVQQGYDKRSIYLVNAFNSILTYIKCTIYDSFYSNIFEVFEKDEVITRREKALDSALIIKLKLRQTIAIMRLNSGWILKLHNIDDTVSYGQIFNKTIQLTPNSEENNHTTILALVFAEL